ncbi:MAG: sigma-70 family RNA polymerase sigma factor [Rhodothermales bacterium]|nr:sigma-70 family RNA polymerase sigma factor [Rhodothermales bacterium]
MDREEYDLIQAARDGDHAAFAALLRRHDRQILQVAHGILGNMQDAYDAWQEGVIKAYSNLSSFRMESRFSTWLTRIVINQALNLRKKRNWARRLSFEQLTEDGPELAADGDPGADDLMIRTELGREIERAMKVLSDRERTVFVMKHMHDYKLREIAVMIDCAEGTVKNYLFRATRKLRSELEKHAETRGIGPFASSK